MKLFIRRGVNPGTHNNVALEQAVSHGYIDMARYLLSFPSVSLGSDDLTIASSFGFAPIVELLLNDPRIDPSAVNNQAFIHALIYNHLDIARMLYLDPRVREAYNPSQLNVRGYNIPYSTMSDRLN